MNREEHDQFLEDAEAKCVEERYNKIAEAELKRRGVTLRQLQQEAENMEQRWAWRVGLYQCICSVHFSKREEHEDLGSLQMGLEYTMDLSKQDSTWVVSPWYAKDLSVRELLDRL